MKAGCNVAWLSSLGWPEICWPESFQGVPGVELRDMLNFALGNEAFMSEGEVGNADWAGLIGSDVFGRPSPVAEDLQATAFDSTFAPRCRIYTITREVLATHTLGSTT